MAGTSLRGANASLAARAFDGVFGGSVLPGVQDETVAPALRSGNVVTGAVSWGGNEDCNESLSRPATASPGAIAKDGPVCSVDDRPSHLVDSASDEVAGRVDSNTSEPSSGPGAVT